MPKNSQLVTNLTIYNQGIVWLTSINPVYQEAEAQDPPRVHACDREGLASKGKEQNLGRK